MVREKDIIAIFQGIHRVMKAEQILKEADVEILLIPAPRELTSDCGLAIRFSPELQQQVLDVLANAQLSPIELYQRCGQEFHRIL